MGVGGGRGDTKENIPPCYKEKYTGDPSLDFHIDPAYELADFIKTQLGIELTNVKELCLREPKKAGRDINIKLETYVNLPGELF